MIRLIDLGWPKPHEWGSDVAEAAEAFGFSRSCAETLGEFRYSKI
jgi:hypothetical protein